MGTISQDLLNFKNSVASNIGTMESKSNDISSKIQSLSSLCGQAKSATSSLYNSENKTLVLGTFDSLATVYTDISSSISGTLTPMLTGASSIVDNVTKLEKINEEIAAQEEIIKNNSGTDDAAISRRNSANSVISSKNIEFNTIHTEALSTLSKLKGMDTTIEIAGESDGASIDNGDIVVEGGTFTSSSFKGKNGTVVDYYIYIPKVADTTTKLPMLIYFHGIGDTVDKNNANNNKNGGLAGLIQTGQLEPKGIVIFPQAKRPKDGEFVDGNYYQALSDLVDEVAEKYNGDKNRLSVSGHSNGGTAAYKIVNYFPGKFAACAPIAGVGNTDEGIKQTHLWAFQGMSDGLVKPEVGLRIALKMEKWGLNARHNTYNAGHDIQTRVYQDTFDDGSGNQVKLIDWLFSQKLNS